MNMTETHPEELLPWYVNQTLAPEEHAVVAAHLEYCDHCRSEVALLQKLREQIKQETPTPTNELGLQRLRRDIKREQGSTAGLPGWLRPAMAAGILVVVMQSAMLVNFWPRSIPMTPLGVQYEGVVLQLTFVSTTTEGDIRKMLNAIHAQLIGGPSALGIYRIRLGIDTSAEQEINDRIVALQARQDVVTHVARE